MNEVTDERERARLSEQFERLKTALPQYELQLDEITRQVLEDDVVTPEEQAEVEGVERQLAELRRRYETLRAQLFGGAVVEGQSEGPRTVVVEVGDDVEQVENVVDLGDVDVSVAMADFTDPDSGFHDAFARSIHEWCQDGGIALNSVRNYMQGQTEPSGLSLNDIGAVVSTIFPMTSPVFTVVSIGEKVGQGYNEYLQRTGEPQPSLAQIHAAWRRGLDTLDSDRFNEQHFRRFIADYKRVNGIPSDAQSTPRAAFLRACESFREDHMPSVQEVERAFTNRILRTITDQDNPLSEDYGYEGIACMSLFMDMHNRTVEGEIRGYIDDCSGEMLEAVKAAYHGSKVIDLPLAIRVKIYAGASARNIATLWRGNRAEGGNDFRLQEGSEIAHTAFMEARVYDQMMVHHLG